MTCSEEEAEEEKEEAGGEGSSGRGPALTLKQLK